MGMGVVVKIPTVPPLQLNAGQMYVDVQPQGSIMEPSV